MVSLCLDEPLVDNCGQKLRVHIYSGGIKKTFTIPAKDMEPAAPHIGDYALVIAGQNVGFVGEVKDGSDDLWFLQPPQSKPKKRSRAKSAKISIPLIPELAKNLIAVMLNLK